MVGRVEYKLTTAEPGQEPVEAQGTGQGLRDVNILRITVFTTYSSPSVQGHTSCGSNQSLFIKSDSVSVNIKFKLIQYSYMHTAV